jgi:hypothetical protein
VVEVVDEGALVVVTFASTGPVPGSAEAGTEPAIEANEAIITISEIARKFRPLNKELRGWFAPERSGEGPNLGFTIVCIDTES